EGHMASYIRRRKFLATLGGAPAASPLAARAQQQTMPVIGLLNSESANEYDYLVRAFREGLNKIGYVEGRNVAIEYRWADGRSDRLAEIAAEFARLKVDLAGKRLDLLRDAISNLGRLAIMGNVGNPLTVLELGELQAAARPLGLQLDTLEIRRPQD